MAGLSRFNFFPRDWFMDTRDLSDRAKGCYIDLLAAMYNQGRPLPYDEKYLCGLAGYKQVRSLRHALSELLASGKLYVENGLLINNRAMEEIEAANRHMKQSAKGGKRRHEKSNCGTKPAQNPSKTRRKVAETEGSIKEKQGLNPCLPSPPPPKKNSNYIFAGAVIRLTQTDFETWEKSYFNIPNLTGVLQNRDDWLAGRPESERKKWFQSTSNVLAKKDAEFAKAVVDDDPYADSFNGVETNEW